MTTTAIDAGTNSRGNDVTLIRSRGLGVAATNGAMRTEAAAGTGVVAAILMVVTLMDGETDMNRPAIGPICRRL